MRGANGGADESASATRQNRRNHARMWVLVSFGSDSGAEAKADDGSDQSMAPVAWLPPHSAITPTLIAPTARMSDPGRTHGGGTAPGNLRQCLAIAAAAGEVFVLGVGTARSKNLCCSRAVACSLLCCGLRPCARQPTQDQQKGGKQVINDWLHSRRLAAIFKMHLCLCDSFASVTIRGDGG
jgi:hypothetical protein